MFSAYQSKDVKTILLLNQWIISADYHQKFGKVLYGFHDKIPWYHHWKSTFFLFWLSQSQTKAQKHQGDTP